MDDKFGIIDESSITSTTYTIDENNLPDGFWYDEDGGCYKAEKCDPGIFGCTWRWSARNAIALGKGYNGQKLSDVSPHHLKILKEQTNAE